MICRHWLTQVSPYRFRAKKVASKTRFTNNSSFKREYTPIHETTTIAKNDFIISLHGNIMRYHWQQIESEDPSVEPQPGP